MKHYEKHLALTMAQPKHAKFLCTIRPHRQNKDATPVASTRYSTPSRLLAVAQ